MVVDVTLPAAPVSFGRLVTMGQAQGVDLADNRVYVADEYTGLSIAEGIRPLWLPMIGRGFGQPCARDTSRPVTAKAFGACARRSPTLLPAAPPAAGRTKASRRQHRQTAAATENLDLIEATSTAGSSA